MRSTSSPGYIPVVSAKPRKKGDFNGDGNIDLADVQTLLKVALKIVEIAPGKEELYNINGDDNIDLQDVVILLKAALKLVEI